MKIAWIVPVLFAFTTATFAAGDYGVIGNGDFKIAGDLTINLRALDRNTKINSNNRLDDPFNEYRARFFFIKQFDSTIKITVEFLFDEYAAPRVNGSYFLFSNFYKTLSARVGLIPFNVGEFGYRSTYFNQNPVIGVPALWQYKTGLATNGNSTNSSLMANRKSYPQSYGSQLGYDACWPTGALQRRGRAGDKPGLGPWCRSREGERARPYATLSDRRMPHPG